MLERPYLRLRQSGSPADGVIDLRGRHLLELEDVAQQYHRPSIIDIKVGYQTWYSGAEEAYIQRCQAKDAATTQAALGFKICGMQARSRLFCLSPILCSHAFRLITGLAAERRLRGLPLVACSCAP